ncbi:MAG: lipoate--protein ligase family protein [Bacteroidales bacterium]|nr:lipoate--protein ligase family protein [Bacteroidales bacterium]
MLLLISQTKDTAINLATEDYLLKNSSENIVYLYIDRPCVVVGKHQNAMAEVNYRFLCENNIPLYRRISGGGTVFHDEGNINFTFIQNGEEGNLVNFRAFIEPIRDFLISLGVLAEIGPRNDILVDGLKVSGNAEHVYRKRTLHHGTLLFSSSLNFLRNALRVEEGKYTDKAVKSVRSKVTNLKDYIKDEFTAEQFFFKLGTFLMSRYQAESLLLEPKAIIV